MRRSAVLFGAVALAATVSCTKNDPAPAPPAGADATATEPADAPVTTDIKTDDLPKQLADALVQAKTRADEIEARWTPQMREGMTQLVSTQYDDTEAALTAILASPHRAPGNADRDVYRRPVETLTFFGLTPQMKVFEYGSGAGWYTEVLAPLLAREGTLRLPGYDHESEDAQVRYGARATDLFVGAPGNLYEHVELVEQTQLFGAPNFGPADSLDMILVFRMMHNVHRFKMWDALMPAVYESLKPGAVLAVVQHRAADDADPDKSAPTGYMPEPWLIEKVSSYGFELAARSDHNANPKDTKDHPGGVWTLPPSLQKGDEDRDKYVAIGESDRSTLKFVKVAK
ncbi:MAG: methyltransferase [Deltaproteobacteria bacterium]|nr:methyltransferase [Deltaproteobacteria bacterium]